MCSVAQNNNQEPDTVKFNRRETLALAAAASALSLCGMTAAQAADGDMVDVAKLMAPAGNIADKVEGNPDAPVTVIEYASPTCPVCANFMINMYPRLKRDYIDTGKIFYVFRTFPRLADDVAAEKLARCMPKDKYMEFQDSLYANQAKWDYEFGIPQPDGVHAALVELAGAAGMSEAEANRCMASPAEEAAITKVGEDGVAKYKVSATPTFVINGQAQAGFEAFFERLDAALAK
jgi:protein-disulfide isomerase